MISKTIKNYIDNNISECSNKLELAYTIYCLLGKKLYYSPLYVKYKNDLELYVNEISLDNPFVNCFTWSELYNELLNVYGIDSKVIGNKHKLVEINLDKFKIRADATVYLPDGLIDVSSDLTNIKFGLDVLFFNLVNLENRNEFKKTINKVNNKMNISNGNDNLIIEEIRLNKNNSIDDRIMYGIDFYNNYFQLCKGEVEQRQLFERYYPLLFDNINNSIIDYYDGGYICKYLLVFDDKYFLETRDGFIRLSYNQLINLVNNNLIDFKYKEKAKEFIKKKIIN